MTQLGLSDSEPRETGSDWRMWALGGLWALLLIFGGAWMSQLDRRIVSLEDSDKAAGAVRERLSMTEVRQTASQQQFDDIKEAIKVLNAKVDQLLYRDAVASGSAGSVRRFDK